MLKKRMMVLLAAAVLTVSVSGCGTEQKTADISTAGTGSQQAEAQEEAGPFEELSLTDLDGNEVGSELFAEHQMTMINIWATFCNPCLNELPELGELAKEYAQTPGGVQIVGICTDVLDQKGNQVEEQIDLAKQVLRLTGADYQNLVPDKVFLNVLMESIPGVPTTFFVDSQGKLLGEAVVGARKKEAWQEIVDARLQLLEK
ncbi:MAG: TlpA disulfide reductase family protein [Negativibacillus sp.]|nr:TlpA disulfide reductase family protein [Negativibacillus sp.]